MDSGAEANCITLRECKRLHIEILPTQQTAVAVDKKTILPVIGEARTNFERNGLFFYFEGLVCNQLSNEIIGGVPFLKYNNINQELNNRRIVVHREGKSHYIMEIPDMAPTIGAIQPRLAKLTEFARSASIMPGEFVDLKLSPELQPDQSYVVEPSSENKNNTWLPQEVKAVGNIIRLTNHSYKPILVPSDTHIVRVRSVVGQQSETNKDQYF